MSSGDLCAYGGCVDGPCLDGQSHNVRTLVDAVKNFGFQGGNGKRHHCPKCMRSLFEHTLAHRHPQQE